MLRIAGLAKAQALISLIWHHLDSRDLAWGGGRAQQGKKTRALLTNRERPQATMSKRVLLPSIPSLESTVSRSNQSSSEESSNGKSSPSINELRNRLTSVAPKQMAPNPEALKFEHNTKSQERTRKRQQPIKLEPLPALKTYQHQKQPEYIYQKNREKLLAAGVLKPTTSAEKRKWPGTVEAISSELQEELKERQMLSAMVRIPTPPKQPRSILKTSACKPGATPTLRTFSGPEEVIKANVTEPLQIIRIICENKNLGFLYMTPAVPKSSIEYDTYNLKIVSYDCINKNDYYTISPQAVIHTYNGEVEYLELERWEQEYVYHRALVKITIFAIFRKWKSFNVWRKNVRCKKINSCRRALQKNLFIVNACLRPAILNIQEMCYRIGDMVLCQIEKGYIYTLIEFKGTQFSQLKDVASRLSEFRELAKEVVRGACRTALLETGFTPDDYFYSIENTGTKLPN
ncbi:dynein heavy chain 6, axonemal-like [Pseudonaja textilis]|uniref:dynein heavy chain 6, axonemal-like n=1 Tax=Pseudonaja textilis TaxID=8673 RepID=UPI000EA9A9D0|nr:dynein heavy chain 6, axonemal-like [Pseudonaja textilis]